MFRTIIIAALMFTGNTINADSVNAGTPGKQPEKILPADTASSYFVDGKNALSKRPPDPGPLYRKSNTTIPAGMLFGSFTKDDGPYLIEGNVIVPSGQILEFGPACTVYVGGVYSTLIVFGQLVARGTANEPVIFMSAKTDAQRWDWDRIYCRNRNRSIFEHCIIRNSNYGIYVENGSVSVQNCLFENNSLYGIAVKNADATIVKSMFTRGHALAVNILSGGEVIADSMIIKENITGLYCADKGILKYNGGSVANNVNGIIAGKESSIEIIGAEITKNKNGVISETEIPSRKKEMVFANVVDVKVVSPEEIKTLVIKPLPVESIVLPSGSAPPALQPGFKAGFSAITAPQEPTASFIGNVTTGVTFYNPHSQSHPQDLDTIESYTIKSDGSIDTLRKINKGFNYQTKYPGEQSKKWFSGIQPELQFFANGKRGNTDINLLMDLYSNQWLSTADYFGKNMFNLTMNYTDHSVVIGDFLESGSETSITGRQITGIRYTGKKFDMGRGEKRFEFKLAAGETEIAKDTGDHEIFVYNQAVDTGMSKHQQITYITEALFKPTRYSSIGAKGIIAHDQYNKPLFRKSLNDPAAVDPVIAQTGCFTGTIFLLNRQLEIFGEIDLGSADTLSDSAAQRIAWYNPEIQKAFPEVLSLFNPSDFSEHYAGSVGARGGVKGYDASMRYLQIAPSYYSAGDPYLVTWRKNLTASVRKPILENVEISGSYEFDHSIIPGIDDLNDPVMTDLNIGSIDASYEIGAGKPSFSINYILQHQCNDARESIVRGDSSYSVGFKKKEISNKVALEGKQTFSNGMAYSLRYQLMLDNDYTDHPDTYRNDEGDRFHNVISGWYNVRIQKLLRNKISLRLATKNENRDSLRAYQYKVADQLSLQIIPRKLNCTISGEYSYKSEKGYIDGSWNDPLLTIYYSGELEIKYSATSRFSCSATGKYEKSYDELSGSSENYNAKIAAFHVTYLF